MKRRKTKQAWVPPPLKLKSLGYATKDLDKKCSAARMRNLEIAIAEMMESFVDRTYDGNPGPECQTGESYIVIGTQRHPDALDGIDSAVAQFVYSWTTYVDLAFRSGASPLQQKSAKNLRRNMKLFWRIRPEVRRVEYKSSIQFAAPDGKLRTLRARRTGWSIYARVALSRKPIRRKKRSK